MKIVILAAGVGKRFRAIYLPKALTVLADGNSILGLQLKILSKFLSIDDVMVVVGYRKEQVMDKFPNLLYVYNPDFAKENTAKSLLRALSKVHDEDVLWINGDVVFRPSVIEGIINLDKTCMVVNSSPVGDEEVKYRANAKGKILEVSKIVAKPQGEALGVNFVKGADLEAFKRNLKNCLDNDYFERGIELAIKEGMDVWTVPVGASDCTEIDFPEDLKKANELLLE